ncbi:MAG: amidohydrolase family protein [Microthrixaceae bacterium]
MSSPPSPPLRGAIDYWCNSFLPEREAAWQRAIDHQGLRLKIERQGDEFCTGEEMVRRLDASGFATLVLVATDPPSTAQLDDPNLFEHVACRAEEIAELSAQHPGRFVGVWSVDPTTGADGVVQAEAMLAQPWCVGLHNHTHSWDRRFDHPDFDDYYALCAERDVPFVMQAGKSGGDFPHECGHPDGIAAPAERHPALRFVLSHTGWPWTDEAIALATRFDNVYLGTASWPLRRWPEELRRFIAGPGRTKVLYGSGFPTTGHAQAARQFADTGLTAGFDAETVELLTARNARNVFTRIRQPVASQEE